MDGCLCVVFFFQAEDGIRDGRVTGVQTCALPISKSSEPLALALSRFFEQRLPRWDRVATADVFATMDEFGAEAAVVLDSEIASALSARPRLAFRKDGQRVLAEIDPARMLSLVVAVHTGN